jgi:hypothetical protein
LKPFTRPKSKDTNKPPPQPTILASNTLTSDLPTQASNLQQIQAHTHNSENLTINTSNIDCSHQQHHQNHNHSQSHQHHYHDNRNNNVNRREETVSLVRGLTMEMEEGSLIAAHEALEAEKAHALSNINGSGSSSQQLDNSDQNQQPQPRVSVGRIGVRNEVGSSAQWWTFFWQR